MQRAGNSTSKRRSARPPSNAGPQRQWSHPSVGRRRRLSALPLTSGPRRVSVANTWAAEINAAKARQSLPGPKNIPAEREAGGEIGRDAKVCSAGGGCNSRWPAQRAGTLGETPPPLPLPRARTGRRCHADACQRLISEPADAVVVLLPHYGPIEVCAAINGDKDSRELNAPGDGLRKDRPLTEGALPLPPRGTCTSSEDTPHRRIRHLTSHCACKHRKWEINELFAH